jgi:aldehyde:ferredoxin oxidoreductase
MSVKPKYPDFFCIWFLFDDIKMLTASDPVIKKAEDGSNETMEMYGNILQVDLTTRIHSFSPFPKDALHTFIGGRGFNVAYLFTHLPLKIDPLSPQNILIFSCGLLAGTRAPASARLHINAVSPLTGLIGSSNIGGYAGAWLRSCDIQSLIIQGRAAEPVYICLSKGSVEIREADFLKGRDTFETQETLQKHLKNDKLKILSIGPGGENLARFACIVSGRDHVAGRTGMGAVMGAKNLKAIAIARGQSNSRKSRTPDAALAVRRYVEKIKASPDFKTFSQYGGAGYVKWADEMGVLATRNYRENRFEDVDKINGRLLKKNTVKSGGCYNCPIQCKAVLQFKKERGVVENAYRPEFEPMCNLGPKCGLNDLEAIVHLDNLCTRLGLDSTSAATAIAFAMDLFDRKILTLEETGTLDLSWGNKDSMETLIQQMAHANKLGAILSRGVRQAARTIGKGADRYAMHVHGLELTAYHPSHIMGTALGYVVSSRGGDYNNVYASLEYRWSREKAIKEFGTDQSLDIHDISGKGPLLKRAVIVNIVLDCLGICKVPALSLLASFDLEEEAQLAAALIATAISPEILFYAGERIAAMEQLFNLRHAPEKMDVKFPQEVMDQENSMLTAENLQYMLKTYYDAMGWDDAGYPKPATLKALGIE